MSRGRQYIRFEGYFAENEADDYAESLIFHTINNTALPLESEHGLRLLLGQDSAYEMSLESACLRMLSAP